ncbi:TerD family protein [Frankia sp. CNm7]|uniref:TerD family protein n=1 Tax=Frankia nepalensis TaxID=1836974 RepID=A0A937UM41_9ACTN|nr:TerD family protein [Frankia nepalensis]MBL7501371.1 TerD family protein [Frankia nepalensis]MBL7514810.1 TerD family protein [Frankia nepalensis]MBL7517808.1 TerD family protein [Frankia nepalensis]MBL7628499.1 TerD family protein [Frankia nepalensis]
MAVVLSKGANAPLPTPDVRVEVSSSTPLDIAALLLTQSGKVRSDADFVFFNQPTGPGVRLVPPSGLEFALTAVPAEIDKVVVTGSLDGSGPPTFAAVAGLTVIVRDGRGGEIARFTPSGLGNETALIMVELYRRAGAWKVRAVGQGYASGLAGIATDFGIAVDDPGAAAASAPARPAQRAAAPPAPAGPPARNDMFDAPTQVVRPDAPPAPQPAAPPPGQQWGPPPGAPPGGQQWGPPPGQPGYGQQPPGYGQPQWGPAQGPPPGQQWGPPQGAPPGGQQWGPPQGPPPGQQWGPPPPGGQQWGPPPGGTPAPAGAPGAVNLDKGRVSLRKGEAVSLVKTGAPPLTRVRMALGWDPAAHGRSIDLDASCILYDAQGKDVDKVWFMSKKGAKGAVRHSGDNLTGQGEGDDETIFVDLGALPPAVTTLVFTVNSFQGQRFTEVRRAYCRLIDDLTNQELVRFDLSESKPSTGLVMCKVQRVPNAPVWTMTAIGEFHDGKTVRAMVDPARRTYPWSL